MLPPPPVRNKTNLILEICGDFILTETAPTLFHFQFRRIRVHEISHIITAVSV